MEPGTRHHARRSAGPHRPGALALDPGPQQDAHDAFEKAVARNKKDALAWRGLGEALVNLGDDEKALSALDRAVELAPRDVRAWESKARALVNGGSRDEEALYAAETAIDLDPDSFAGWQAKGTALNRMRSYLEATEALRRAAALAPDDGAIRLALGQSLEMQNSYEDALESYRKAITVTARSVPAWEGLGRCYGALGRHEAARQAFQQAIALDSRSTPAIVGMAISLINDDREGEALEFLDTHGGPRPSPEMKYNRTVALFRLNRRSEGLQVLRELARGNPPLAKASELLTTLEVKSSRSRRGAWVDYWFGKGAGWMHRVCGTALLVALVVLIAAPLLAERLVSWFNTGQDWSTMALPTGVVVALLVLPTVSNVEIGSVKIKTLEPSSGEEEDKQHRPFPEIKTAHRLGEIGLAKPEYDTSDPNLSSAQPEASADMAVEHTQEAGH